MAMENAEFWLITALVLVALAVAGWLLTRDLRRRRSLRLQQRFGPEYSHVVAEQGDRTKAEAELLAREKRVERLKLVALTREDRARFGEAWSALQTRFVDNPQGVVVEADRLVRVLMLKRGYPMGDFERRAADISVDHPKVVEAYRSARAIAVRDQQNEASTEELRKAVVYYRTLFDDLLEIPDSTSSQKPEVVNT